MYIVYVEYMYIFKIINQKHFIKLYNTISEPIASVSN